jgi:hypothetical protein
MTRLPPPPTHDVLKLFSKQKYFPKKYPEVIFRLRIKERKQRGGIELPSQSHLLPFFLCS